MSAGLLPLFIVGLPFLGGLFAALLPTDARNAAVWLSGAIALIGLLLSVSLFPEVADGGVVRYEAAWLPQLGLNFTLRMDGFAWLFCVLVTGIGLLVVIYARYYMSPEDPVPRFFSFFLAFMGAMLGVVMSGNLLVIVFFWEMTSLFSFVLIGYWSHNAAAREGARMALTITTGGGLCLLAGVLILGNIVGSYDLDHVLLSGQAVRDHDLYLPALILILLGALTKSAQFPFHFWLPHAMAAPTPVSAYLHSATMVKAGVFLLARLWPVLAGTDAWLYIVGGAGLCTLVLGAYVAIFQHDMKGLLAYSTISHLGLITLLLGLSSPLAAVAAIFHIMNHAIFKASLFMATGVIDHESGTRDIRRLSGLYRLMPFTATLAMVASAAMAGVPLLNGFLSKEMFFAETIVTHGDSFLDQALPYIATLASAFAVTYSLRFIHGAFFGPPPVDLPRTPHEPPHWMRFPIEFLVLACLVIGIVPGLTVEVFLDAAVRAVLGPATPEYSLAVWHGFTLPLLMSSLALAGGVLLYLLLQNYLKTGVEGAPLLHGLGGKRIFERTMVALSFRWARTAESVLGTRRLQPQMRLLVLTAVLAALLPIYHHGLTTGHLAPAPLQPAFVGMWVVGVGGAVASAYLAKFHRLAALISMGVAGLITCLTFIWFSAPDLALTQLLVEIVVTVLLLLGLRWMPKRLEDAPADRSVKARWRRLRDFALAVVVGLGMSLLALASMTRPLPERISNFFLDRAYTEGGGTNVVNVILVDFRGFDTLGEITVLCVVALTVFALLRRFRPPPESVVAPDQKLYHDSYDPYRRDGEKGAALADTLMVPGIIIRALFAVVATVAVYLFMRGHDLPGGGFVAGLTLSIAFILQYMAGGTRWVEARLRILPVRWMGLGVTLCVATGAGAWLFAHPFLTSHSQYADLPVIGSVPLASAVMFDLGVFVLVVGATVLMLIAIAHQSIRTYRPIQVDGDGKDGRASEGAGMITGVIPGPVPSTVTGDA